MGQKVGLPRGYVTKTDRTKEGVKRRVSRFREREKERHLQIALAAARLVMGKDIGDARRALADFIDKQSKQTDIPDDYASTLMDAADALRSKRRR